MLLIRITIKKVSITDIFFYVHRLFTVSSNLIKFHDIHAVIYVSKRLIKHFHKFFKFWCTDLLFHKYLNQQFIVNQKLVCIARYRAHLLNIRPFFVEMIFKKFFFTWYQFSMEYYLIYSNYHLNINFCWGKLKDRKTRKLEFKILNICFIKYCQNS